MVDQKKCPITYEKDCTTWIGSTFKYGNRLYFLDFLVKSILASQLVLTYFTMVKKTLFRRGGSLYTTDGYRELNSCSGDDGIFPVIIMRVYLHIPQLCTIVN